MENWSNNLATSVVAIAPRPMTGASGSVRPLQQRTRRISFKRKRIACKACRQDKLKCESSNLQTCSRCKALSLPCVFDNEYRRYNKRLKLQDLATQIEALRSEKAGELNQSSRDQQPSPIPQQSGTHNDGPQNGNNGYCMQVEATAPALLTAHAPFGSFNRSQEHFPARYPQTIGNTTLSAKQITRLFQIFYREYESRIPIFEVQISPDECFLQSSLLFWTIVTIASRRDEEEPNILASLAPAIRSLLWQTVGNPPHSRLDLKAMILICLWPFPTSSLSTDPSYILAATCKSSSMHIGLHKPYFVQDFSRVKTIFSPEELRDALIVWSVCFIAAESITSFQGQQPLFVTDSTLDMICGSNTSSKLPLNLYHLVLIWRFCNRVHRVMASRERRVGSLGENDSGVLLPLYEGELNQLRQQLGDTLSKSNEIILLYASLQLRCYYFLERHVKPSFQEGMVKAYGSALDIIWKSQEMELESRLLSRGPVMFSNAVAMAATLILKILQGNYSQLVDIEEGRKALDLSLELLQKCSIEDNDLPARFFKVLAQMWTSQPEEPSPQEGLKVTTRLGASLLHDTLWKWREKFGGQSIGPQQLQGPPVSENTSADSRIPSLTNGLDLENSHGRGVGIVGPDSTHSQMMPSVAMAGEVGEIDLANEISNDWLWGIEGLSTLMAMNSNAIDLPLNISNNYTNNGILLGTSQ